MKNTQANAAARLAAASWADYQAIKDANGGSLKDADHETLKQALAIHARYCDLQTAADQQVSVQTNIRAIERALDCNAGEVETDYGIVRWSSTVVYGPHDALIEIASQVDEMAEDAAHHAADNAEREVPEAFIERWVQASYRAAAQVREAAQAAAAEWAV